MEYDNQISIDKKHEILLIMIFEIENEYYSNKSNNEKRPIYKKNLFGNGAC